MKTSLPPRIWYRPQAWRLLDVVHNSPRWWVSVCLGVGTGLVLALPDAPPRPKRLDVVTYQDTQARQEALLQGIQDALKRIRELLEHRR